MNVRQMPLEELELLSYADTAYELLKLDKKPKNISIYRLLNTYFPKSLEHMEYYKNVARYKEVYG